MHFHFKCYFVTSLIWFMLKISNLQNKGIFQFSFSKICIRFKLLTLRWKTCVVNNCERKDRRIVRENAILETMKTSF